MDVCTIHITIKVLIVVHVQYNYYQIIPDYKATWIVTVTLDVIMRMPYPEYLTKITRY